MILPVLDEAEALDWVLDRFPVGYSPIVVDNGSTDGSAEIAARLGARVVSEPQRGFGSACYRGLINATTDVVCFMDCDGSLDPAELPSVAAPVEAGLADLMLGARPSDRTRPWHTRVANRFLTAAVTRRSGVNLTDIGPMRAVNREGLIALDLQDRRFAWPLEMVLRAAECGWHIGEVPVSHRTRTGTSKVTGTMKGTVLATIDMTRTLR